MLKRVRNTTCCILYLQAMVKWFSEFDDEQKNIVLKRLLVRNIF